MFMRTNGNFLSACIEGILRLFTNFYFQRKFSIFLRGRVHNLDLLKSELLNDNPAKKNLTHDKLNVGKHLMLRFYWKHKLASKLLLYNKETQVEVFFESVFGKSNCSGNQGVIAGVSILTRFHIFTWRNRRLPSPTRINLSLRDSVCG
jgi:hypothetical protein